MTERQKTRLKQLMRLKESGKILSSHERREYELLLRVLEDMQYPGHWAGSNPVYR